MSQHGSWFDGLTALDRRVQVVQGPDGLVLVEEDGTGHPVPKGDLVRIAGPGPARFGLRSTEGWRLELEEPVDSALLAALPRRAGSLAPGAGYRTIGLLAGISVAATLLAGLIIFAPEAIAKRMPFSWERRLGAAFDIPIEAARCENPAADLALRSIVDRIDPEARRDGFTVELIDFDQANAAALPGGRMIVFNGLFDNVDDPDAIAGIIAHEIAHVRRRHVAAGMVREMGLGTVISLLGGGAIASNAGGLLAMKFTRTAEAEADADAIIMLRRAGIDPRPTAAAFEEFRKQEGEFPEWMGDHPASAGRAKLFAVSFDPTRRYRPTLGPAEAKALMSACR